MVKIVAEQPEKKYIELLVDGSVETEPMKEIFAQLEQRVQEWGEVIVLEEVRDIGKIEFGAFWKDLSFGLKNMKAFPRIAVVTDISWVQSITRMADPIFKADIRVFPVMDKEVARTWLLGENSTQRYEKPSPPAPM